MRKIFLSHVLGTETPAYGGSKTDFIMEHVRCIDKGDSCNALRWTMSNHIGTHMDAPLHFDANGKSIEDLSASWCFFNNCQVVQYKAAQGELIKPNEWCQQIKRETEILIIKTGFENHRSTPLYWQQNPGLSKELGFYLRESFPHLRAIGFDFISLTSYLHRPEGRIAHKAFLGNEGSGNPICIIEDMRLAELNENPHDVFLAPLRVTHADGAPVTIVASVSH